MTKRGDKRVLRRVLDEARLMPGQGITNSVKLRQDWHVIAGVLQALREYLGVSTLPESPRQALDRWIGVK